VSEICGGFDEWRDEGEEKRDMMVHRAFSVWRNEDVAPGPVKGNNLAGECDAEETTGIEPVPTLTSRAEPDLASETVALTSVSPVSSVLGKGQGGDPSNAHFDTVEITSTVTAPCPSPLISTAMTSEPLTSVVPASSVFGVGNGRGADPSQYYVTILTSKPHLPLATSTSIQTATDVNQQYT
jgi:hypothetical protein